MLSIVHTNKLAVEHVQYYRSVYKYSSIQRLKDVGKMHGARRVITFCCLTAVLPTILIVLPLYLRHSIYTDTSYALAESDVIEITDGISPIFCQKHVLRMNTTFNAYQLSGMPEISDKRKHIRLKKSIQLPDDTLEYWGFFLLKGAIVSLKVCSRYEGSRLLVVQGDRNLRTCGLLEHNRNKVEGGYAKNAQQTVRVIYEGMAQEIFDSAHSNDIINNTKPNSNITNKTNSDDHVIDSDRKNTNVTTSFIVKDFQIDKNREIDELNLKNAIDDASLEKFADTFLEKRLKKTRTKKFKPLNESIPEINNEIKRHRRRHAKHRQREQEQERKRLVVELNENVGDREKRDLELNTGILLDGGVEHGGNAVNFTESDENESSVSSFENSLLECYRGQILHKAEFDANHNCTDVHFLDVGKHNETRHEVYENGYYYYIFYSDNDLTVSDIHAVFNIYKPTYQYVSTRECKNKTECVFPISFWSNETVIVEVPTRDGIEHEEDDVTILISVCQPRMAVYMIFPIAVLFLILVCAFL